LDEVWRQTVRPLVVRRSNGCWDVVSGIAGEAPDPLTERLLYPLVAG